MVKTEEKKDIPYIVLLAVSIAFLIFSVGNLAVRLYHGTVRINKPRFAVLSDVPKEFRDSYYVSQKELGCCQTMTGKVAVTVVKISDSVGQWDAEATAELEAALENHKKDIENEAAGYHADLSLSIHYYDVSMTGDVCSGEYSRDWQDTALQKAGLPNLQKVHNHLERKYKAKEAPLVFVFNKPGRAYAEIGREEFVVLYARKNFDSFQHELTHVFGARDYYYPSEVKAIAANLFPDSVMNGGTLVDPFTAYLIGWQKELPDVGLQFLQETACFTTEYLKNEGKDQTLTGKGTKQFSNGTYTGDLVRGEPHGIGTMHFDNGGWYIGEWKNGSFSGYGTAKIVNKDGRVYEGELQNGVYHGKGTLRKENGDWYTGQWEAGKMTGSGSGKNTFESGAFYEGEYLNGHRHGQGTYHYDTGSVYTGQWSEGKRTGVGTMEYSNGGWYTGNWLDDEKTGQGKAKMVQSSGVYEGEVLDGKQHGQGTYVWTNGETYVGQWTEGKITGYGTVTKPNGSVTTGYWLNGVFQY